MPVISSSTMNQLDSYSDNLIIIAFFLLLLIIIFITAHKISKFNTVTVELLQHVEKLDNTSLNYGKKCISAI